MSLHDIDIAQPLEPYHPDNKGVVLDLLPLRGVTCGAGTRWYDSSLRKAHGDLSLTPTWQSNGSLAYSGSNSLLGSASLPLSNSYTWSVVVRGNTAGFTTNPTGSIFPFLLDLENTGAVSGGFCWSSSADTFSGAFFHQNAAGTYTPLRVASAAVLPANTWIVLSASYDNATMFGYVNGVLIGSVSVGAGLRTYGRGYELGKPSNNLLGFAGASGRVTVLDRSTDAGWHRRNYQAYLNFPSDPRLRRLTRSFTVGTVSPSTYRPRPRSLQRIVRGAT